LGYALATDGRHRKVIKRGLVQILRPIRLKEKPALAGATDPFGYLPQRRTGQMEIPEVQLQDLFYSRKSVQPS
jgi:hypothetical protein